VASSSGPNAPLRIALFGGTFDPIHNAHLKIAREAARQYHLSRVLFIPAAKPPHKSGVTRVPYEDRLRMVELACQGEPLFEASRLEAGAKNSYSIETIERVIGSLGKDQEVFFLIGSDAFAEIRTWHRWQELFDLAHVVIAHRPGFRLQELRAALRAPLRKIYLQRLAGTHGMLRASAGSILTREITALDISATHIRAMLAQGSSPRYLVPDSVLEYIDRNHLYKDSDAR